MITLVWMKTTKEILLEAADLIEKYGWHQGYFRSSDGCMCMLGACVRAIDEEARAPIWSSGSDEWKVYFKAFEAIGSTLDLIGSSTPSVPGWNDTPGRTKEEVLEVLRKAAERS